MILQVHLHVNWSISVSKKCHLIAGTDRIVASLTLVFLLFLNIQVKRPQTTISLSAIAASHCMYILDDQQIHPIPFDLSKIADTCVLNKHNRLF